MVRNKYTFYLIYEQLATSSVALSNEDIVLQLMRSMPLSCWSFIYSIRR